MTNFRALYDWSTEALTVFANGFVAGLGGGVFVGAGAGAASNVQAVPLDHGTFVALTTALICAAGNGLKRVIVWHDSHLIPNPFAAPAEPDPAPIAPPPPGDAPPKFPDFSKFPEPPPNERPGNS